ncbi:MAG: hypothetical protein GYB65_01635 [Chloroflexi bacterium]|nr:hypothetical protein [Chloroflexota bacterium]
MQHRKNWLISLALVLVTSLSACDQFSDGSEVNDLETEVFQLQSTVDNMSDMDSLSAAATQVAIEITRLQAQANAGTPGAPAFAPQPVATSSVPQTANTPAAAASNPGTPIATIPSNPAGGSAPASGGVPTVAVNQTPGGAGGSQATSTTTTFSNTTTAPGVRQEDGCAAGTSLVFGSDADEIFVVTTIRNLQAGSTIGARWMVNAQEYYYEENCWTPDQNWDEVCAWCSISANSGVFDTGSWSVELLLDGELRSRARFQVNPADGMVDEQ